PGCSPCPAPAACTPTPGSARSCGRSPPTGCAGRWPSTWTPTRPPPGPPWARPAGPCWPATSATRPSGRRPACPRRPWAPRGARRRGRAVAEACRAADGMDGVRRRAGRVLDEVERAVVGKRAALELVLVGLLADGHVLLDDYPGLATTLIARSFAQVPSLSFARVQFTPDLMPSDVTGSSIYSQRLGDFEFRPGPVFTNLLLGDEINRSPPKTQAALLEAMQERQVTIDGVTRPLERPFLVVATQNPIEFEGTYPLPEAQLDRFLMRLS